jgi:hypothetical protein
MRLLALVAVTLSAQTPFVANYDEAKVGAYVLPDPLKFADGKPVRTARDWTERRRPEILRLFEEHVYGRIPPAVKIEYEVIKRDPKALGGAATRQEIAVWPAGKQAPSMSILLYVPNDAKGPVPAFVSLNFPGNHTVQPDPSITLSTRWIIPGPGVVDNRATEAARGAAVSRWPVDLIISRGYALATVYYGDLFPDRKDGAKDSIVPHLPASNWNAIGAWAYGLSRMLDYLETDSRIDAKRVAVVGHSRLGKAALWAGATDPRFALVVGNDSGEGGAALARRNFGETVERINTAFPHWFTPKYSNYNQAVNQLPVDQHMLLALIAPRPLYITSATEDQWADPHGEFLACVAAGPVYRLLGTDGFAGKDHTLVEQPVRSRIGYHLRAGKHDITRYDWEQFLAFADLHLKKAALK